MAVYVKPSLCGNKLGETKRKVIEASIMLFSEKSCSTVSTRDIARAVDIKPASLYSHFSTKDDILRLIYVLYEENLEQSRPDLASLLIDAETGSPHDVLLRANVRFAHRIQETMDRITTIAAMESKLNRMSEDFLVKNIVRSSWDVMSALLARMIELKRIEWIDIDAFLTLHANFLYGVALRNFTRFPLIVEERDRSLALLFMLIRPTGI